MKRDNTKHMASGTLVRRPAVLLALALCAVGGVVTLLGRLASGPAVEIKKTPLTTEAGAHAYPAFSPDGNRVAYSAHDSAKDAVFHIYVRPVAGNTPLQVTNGEGSDIGPAWSPDGKDLAFVRLVEERQQVVVVPSAGGAERKVAEFDAPSSGDDQDVELSPSVAWSRDGKTLLVSAPSGDKQIPAISTVPAAGGPLRAITRPPEDSRGDTSPAVSPDGKSVAFVRKADGERSDIYLCGMQGGPARQLTFDGATIRGIAWTPSGTDLMYSANRNNGFRLWRVPAYGGSPRDLLVSGNHATYPTVAPAGYRLAFTESPSVSQVWLAQLGSLDPEHERPVLRSSGRELNPSFSPDGKRIADISDQSGEQEIWITEADGTRNQLTRLENRRMGQPLWTADGKMLLCTMRGPNGQEVFTVPADGGKATRVLTDVNDASWSHDGKSIYYSSRMGGEIYKAAADGTNPQLITKKHHGGSDPRESADGKFVFYHSRRSIWRVPSDGGDEEEFFVPEHDLMWGSLHPTAKGVYYLEFARSGRALVVTFYDFATKKSEPVVRFKNTNWFDGFSISPDGRYVLYSKVDQNETSLEMVENFR
jgi:Tol biopolymer transport system component